MIAKTITAMPMPAFVTGAGASRCCSPWISSSTAEPVMKADWPRLASGSALPCPKRCSRSAGVRAWGMAMRVTRAAAASNLEALRHDAIARPMWRPRHGPVAETLLGRGDTRLEHRAARHRARLVGCPRADLRLARAGREIGVGLGGAHRLGRALDAHLAQQRLPVEAQRNARIGGEFAALAAVHIGGEDEAAFIDPP